MNSLLLAPRHAAGDLPLDEGEEVRQCPRGWLLFDIPEQCPDNRRAVHLAPDAIRRANLRMSRKNSMQNAPEKVARCYLAVSGRVKQARSRL